MSITFYEKRLINEVEITQQLSDIYWGIIEAQEIGFEFDNADGLFSDLLTAGEEFRNKGIKCRISEPLAETVITFLLYGKIVDFNITNIAKFTVAVGQHVEFDVDIPKKVYETTDWLQTPPTIKNPPQDLGKPYPLVFGRCKKVPLINVHWDFFHDYYDFIVCAAGTGVTESNNTNKATTVNIYRNKVLVAASEYTVYDGSQGSPYHDYAFIRFTKEQIDFSGNPYELTADFRGLKLGSDSTATRNFVRVIQYLLSDTIWGLGLTVNTASFNTAAASMAEYLCDGAIPEQRKAIDIINELLFCCRGRLDYNEAGEIVITCDNYTAKVSCVFGHKDGVYENIISIDEIKKTPVREALKSFTLNYGWNAWESGFTYKNKRSIFSFGEEKIMDLHFVRDHVTADKITSYQKQLMVYGDNKLAVKVGMEARDRTVGDITRIILPAYNIDGSYQIRKISRSLNKFDLALNGYDALIYQYIVGTMPIDAGDDALPDYSKTAPSPPTTFLKTSSGTSQGTDGTTSAWFLLSAVALPATNAVTKVKFGYLKTGETAYTFVDGNKPTSGNIWTGRIDGLVPGIYYNLVAVSENASGQSSIGNPVWTSLLAPGDTTVPATVTGLTGSGKYKTWHFGWTRNSEPDLKSYHVQIGGYGFSPIYFDKYIGANSVDHTDDAIGYGTLYCRVTAVDFTGNESTAWSAIASATTAQTQTGDVGNDAITALKILNNEISEIVAASSVSVLLGNSDTIICSQSITTQAGDDLLIIAKTICYSDAGTGGLSTSANFRIKEGLTVLDYSIIFHANVANEGPSDAVMVCCFVPNVTAGFHTYTFTGFYYGGWAPAFAQMGKLQILRVRR